MGFQISLNKMDHVSATKTNHITERENISGARVFDGEDQGKSTFLAILAITVWYVRMILNGLFEYLQVLEIGTKCNSYNKETGVNNKSQKSN